MRVFLFTIVFCTSYLFALTPFSLEGFKEANVKVLYKGKLLSKEFKTKLKKDLIKELEKAGIKTSSRYYSNLAIRIQIADLGKTKVVNTEMLIVEDVYPKRDKSLQNMAITYKRNDFFDTDENIEKAVYESVIEYLLFDFLEQYKEENS